MASKFLALLLLIALTSVAPVAQQGWFASNPGESCDDACSGKEACNLMSLQSIDTKLEFSKIPLRGFQTTGVRDPEEYCAYPQSYSPAMGTDGCSKFRLFAGQDSTCSAKEQGIIRACCCSNSGGCSLDGGSSTGTTTIASTGTTTSTVTSTTTSTTSASGSWVRSLLAHIDKIY